MENYFLGKLSIINYKMAIHEGDANRRLASQSVEILHKLFPCAAPDKYRKNFSELISRIEKTLENIHKSGLHPARIDGIRNSTAVKYIKLLIEMEHYLKEDQAKQL